MNIHWYAFDRVLDQYATQEEIYETTTKSLIPFVTNGFNATVFAYGATGMLQLSPILPPPPSFHFSFFIFLITF